MFLPVDASTQFYLFFMVAVLAFFLASAMDGVLGGDGFGIIGNQVIIMSGFYLGWFVARLYGFPITSFVNIVIVGLIGAFAALVALSVLKAILARL